MDNNQDVNNIGMEDDNINQASCTEKCNCNGPCANNFGCGIGIDNNILFFFLLLVVLFLQCGCGYENMSSLLFFFLILILIINNEGLFCC